MFFKHPVTSIDLSECYIKILSFSGWFQKKIKLIGQIRLPDNSIVEGRIENKKNVILSLRKLAESMQITKGKRLALGVPVGEADIKVITLKSKNKDDLNTEITERSEEIWGEALANKAFAYHLLPLRDPKDKRQALLVTTPETLIEEKISLVKAAQFKVGLMDLNSFALYNMVDSNYSFSKGLNIILNIEYRTSQIVYISEGDFSGEDKILFGEENYFKNIIEHLNIQHEKTKNIITSSLKYKNLLYTKYKEIIHSTHSLFLTQVSSKIEEYLASEKNIKKHTKVTEFYLTGDGCNHQSYASTIQKKFETKTQIINPLKNYQAPKEQEKKIFKERNCFSIASGLANRGFYYIK